jgi:hypothetical protein
VLIVTVSGRANDRAILPTLLAFTVPQSDGKQHDIVTNVFEAARPIRPTSGPAALVGML